MNNLTEEERIEALEAKLKEYCREIDRRMLEAEGLREKLRVAEEALGAVDAILSECVLAPWEKEGYYKWEQYHVQQCAKRARQALEKIK